MIDVRTWANLATAVRVLIAVPLGLWALTESSVVGLVAAYAVYWIGDVLDGWLARLFDQETRLGAVLDIISDRACSAVLVCALTVLQPDLWPALAIFLVQFMALDCVLSLAFLRWSWLVSPNYFYRVDPLTWRLNWSPPAKSINTVAVVAVVATGQLPLALLVAVAQLALKVWTAHRVLGLTPQSPPLS